MVITVIVKVVMVDESLYKQNRCQKTFYEGETLKRAEILNKVMQKKKKMQATRKIQRQIMWLKAKIFKDVKRKMQLRMKIKMWKTV